MQGAFMHRELPLHQGMQSLWRHGTVGQGESGGAPQALPRLLDLGSRSGRPILPLQGGASGRKPETSVQSQPPLPSAHGETSGESETGGETSCQDERRSTGADTNRRVGVRSAASCPMGQHQRGRALPGLLGHGFPGDPHHPQGSPGDEAAGHPELSRGGVHHQDV
jgi:hypothetical protein